MSGHLNPFCSTRFATSAALTSSPTTVPSPELLIVDACKSTRLVAPASSCSGNLPPSGMWSNTEDFRYTGPCTTATATTTPSTATDPSRSITIKPPAAQRKDEGDDSREAAPEQGSITSSVLLSTAPHLFGCIPAIAAINAPCSQAQALVDCSLSGTGDLCLSTPFLALTSEDVLARLTCLHGTQESGPGSSGPETSMLGEMHYPPTAALITFPLPSLKPPPLDSLHPPSHRQYTQSSPLTSLQQPDLTLVSYSPTGSLFDFVHSSNQRALMPVRMSTNIDRKTTSEGDDSSPDDSCKTASDDAVIAAIQQYLENFPVGERISSKLQYTSLEGIAEDTVAYPQVTVEKPPEEKKSKKLDDLVRPFQKPSTDTTTPTTATTRLSLGTVPILGKLGHDTDIQHPSIEDATFIRVSSRCKFTPDEVSSMKRDKEYKVTRRSSPTAKRPVSHDNSTTQITRLYSLGRTRRSPHFGPDQRLQHISEELDDEQWRNKNRLSFQEAGKLIDRSEKIARNKEALMRKRTSTSSSVKRKSSHSWTPSPNIASSQSIVGDMPNRRMASGQRTQISFVEKSKVTLHNTIRFQVQVDKGVNHTSQRGRHPGVGGDASTCSNAIFVQNRAQEGPVQSHQTRKHSNPGGCTNHERKQNDAGAAHADQNIKIVLRKQDQDFSISVHASDFKDANYQACTWAPISKPIQARSSSQSFDPLKSNGKHKLNDSEPSTSHKKCCSHHRVF